MPELPEVESVRRQLDPRLRGRRVLSVRHEPQRRFHGLQDLVGREVLTVGRRGKFLVCPLSGDRELIINLGMTGSLRFDLVDRHARARIALDDGRELVFRDPRRFGRITVVPAGDYALVPTLQSIGPEPLTEDFDPRAFADALSRSRAPVKAVLLGQRVVAGVGNIYADEALWRSRIHPGSRRVGRARAQRLHRSIREVLAESITREGTTFSDYRMVNGASGRNAGFLDAYGRGGLPCARCSTPLRRTVIAGRGTTYCPTCQRI